MACLVVKGTDLKFCAWLLLREREENAMGGGFKLLVMFYFLSWVMGICCIILHTFYIIISSEKEEKNTGFGVRQNWTEILAPVLNWLCFLREVTKPQFVHP